MGLFAIEPCKREYVLQMEIHECISVHYLSSSSLPLLAVRSTCAVGLSYTQYAVHVQLGSHIRSTQYMCSWPFIFLIYIHMNTRMNMFEYISIHVLVRTCVCVFVCVCVCACVFMCVGG